MSVSRHVSNHHSLAGTCIDGCCKSVHVANLNTMYIRIILNVQSFHFSNGFVSVLLLTTRTVRKSDYTPALALPEHMAGISDKKCREKENTGKNK